MARRIPFGTDRNVHLPRYGGARLALWSYFTAEVAPDLIVTPLLFGTDPKKSHGSDRYTLDAQGILVLLARGEAQVAALFQDVAPLLRRFTFAYFYDADRRRLYDARRADLWMQPSQLSSIVRSVLAGFEGEHLDSRPGALDYVCGGLDRALDEMPTAEEVAAFRALPAVEARVAEAARRFEAAPIRLWEAMLWRGENYRWELIRGEVPLVGELWSPLAANRTLMQCVADAEVAFSVRATEDGGWILCGPLRLRQRDTCVEIRVRLTSADRRAAFLPSLRLEGEEAMPSLLGVLLAGGGKGKTEMMNGYVDSVLHVHERQRPEDVAAHLAGEIRRISGAGVTVEGSDRPWPESEGDDWRVYYWKRFVYVNMPAARAGGVAWDALSGLHLSDDFVFWRWRQERAAEPSPDDASPAGR